MRITILALSSIALAVVGLSGALALFAIAHPVGCPGAFFGCPANGEEASYTAALFADGLLAFTGLLTLIIGATIRTKMWRVMTILVFLLTFVVFPLPMGLFAAIFLSTVWPGYGVFGYLIIPCVAGIVLLLFGLQWPVRTYQPSPPLAPQQ